MSTQKRICLGIVGIVAALFCAGLVWLLSFGRDGEVGVLPNPNGYEDLRRAGQAVVVKAGDVAVLDHDALRSLLETNAEALRRMRVGLGRKCEIPTRELIANFSNLSPELVSLKSLAVLLTAEARFASLENRPADAARSSVDAIRLGSSMSHGGVIMNRLVGIACENMGSRSLIQTMPALDSGQLRLVALELEKIDESAVKWSQVIQNENRFVRAQFGTIPNPIRLIPELRQARDVRRASEERDRLAAAHLRLLTVEIALRAFAIDQGHAPASLFQLVPQYLQAIPVDPFSGHSLIYRPTGTNWVLYSVGPDRVDDGGKRLDKIKSGGVMIGFGGDESTQADKGDLFYDTKW